MGFLRQEYWSELPFPSGDLLNTRIKPVPPAWQADSLPLNFLKNYKKIKHQPRDLCGQNSCCWISIFNKNRVERIILVLFSKPGPANYQIFWFSHKLLVYWKCWATIISWAHGDWEIIALSTKINHTAVPDLKLFTSSFICIFISPCADK